MHSSSSSSTSSGLYDVWSVPFFKIANDAEIVRAIDDDGGDGDDEDDDDWSDLHAKHQK